MLTALLAAKSLWTGMAHIRRGRVNAHQREMRSLYWTGLMVAGAFTFLPGRVFNRMLFPENAAWGYVVICVIAAAVVGRMIFLRQQDRARLSDSNIFA